MCATLTERLRAVPTIQRAGRRGNTNPLKRRPYQFSGERLVRHDESGEVDGIGNSDVIFYRGVAPSLANLGASRVQIASIVFVGLNQPLETTECGERVQVYTSPSVFCDSYA